MNLDQKLMDAAVAQLDRRWPAGQHGGAAAMYLEDGRIVTSVGFDNVNGGASLCGETGAICQAYTLGLRVTASVFVFREIGGEPYVMAPCGICQERLAMWGPDVQVAVPDPASETGWGVRTLAEVHPYYWAKVFAGGEWPPSSLHAQP
ncbi:cytidine deaminase [Longispora albida]|uniref:cytidine deaminase n=1 Tax=Longispora albida TaxID=203523 RepID=UPI00039D4C08|nr:cytidine deaminase [Longispora albida]